MTNILQDGAAWALGILKSYAGTSVSYVDPYGITTAITAVLHEETTEHDNNNGIATIIRRRKMAVANADVTIDVRGTVVIDDVDWAISQRAFNNGALTEVLLERHELHEQSRPNLRRS